MTKNVRWLVGVLVVVTAAALVVAGIAIGKLTSKGGSEQAVSAGSSAASPEVVPTDSEYASAMAEVDAVNAKVAEMALKNGHTVPTWEAKPNEDGSIRHVPRGLFDDSSFVPGQTVTDERGAPLHIPLQINGDSIARFDNPGAETGCQKKTYTTIDVQQQYVNGRRLLNMIGVGPRFLETVVPSGYSNDPLGAAIAASNFYTGALNFTDKVAMKMYEQLSTGDKLAELVKQSPKTDYPATFPLHGPRAFRTVSCAENAITVDLAFYYDRDNDGNLITPQYSIYRMPMIWDTQKQTWIFDGSSKNFPIGQGDIKNLGSEWTRIKLV